jgi:hypothetical protein
MMGNGRLQLASANRHRAALDALPVDDSGYDHLRAFFESCWSVKDHALSDLPASQRQQFEKAVDSVLCLRLVADVANRSKHVTLTKRDRVGAAVTFRAIHVFDGADTRDATSEYSITLNDGSIYAAIAIADDALRAWDAVLGSFTL